MSKKSLASLALVCCLAITASAGCGGSNQPNTSTASTASQSASTVSKPADGSLALPADGGFTTVSYQFSEDKYRTYYEIFPYSFYDSNDDGIGDINGITKKLDYLNDGDASTTDDLGIDGIWLMPIMQSPSYHKYNVADYMTVDEAYGSNEDFKKMLDEAHKRHIDVIIDLVINHTSRQHEWFVKAIQELGEGKTDGYAAYYNFMEDHNAGGWRKAPVGKWYYEGQFDDDMPDLNLQNPAVRKEIEDIVKYWLDLGVDGFRLDAVYWYESEKGVDESVADLKWLYDYAKTVKPDVYMIGECWKEATTIKQFYESGVDSFFNFTVQGATGDINMNVGRRNALVYCKYLQSWQERIQEANPNAIDAQFLSNHDTARSAGYIDGETRKRLNAAMYLTSQGNPFIYYGEEIEMEGSQNDPEKRKGMYWSSTDKTGYVSNIPGNHDTSTPEKSVEDALKDKDSLLNFYKRLIALRNQNPEIARGKVTAVEFDNKNTAGYVADYKGSKAMVIYNLADKSVTVDVPKDKFEIKEVRGYVLCDTGDYYDADKKPDKLPTYDDPQITVKDQKVTLPAYSVIVLK